MDLIPSILRHNFHVQHQYVRAKCPFPVLEKLPVSAFNKKKILKTFSGKQFDFRRFLSFPNDLIQFSTQHVIHV